MLCTHRTGTFFIFKFREAYWIDTYVAQHRTSQLSTSPLHKWPHPFASYRILPLDFLAGENITILCTQQWLKCNDIFHRNNYHVLLCKSSSKTSSKYCANSLIQTKVSYFVHVPSYLLKKAVKKKEKHMTGSTA